LPILLALLGAALAAPADLTAWSARTGLALSAPARGATQQTPEGLALVGSGESLLLADAKGDGALDAALAAMWAPFVEMGIARPTPTDRACMVAGRATTCRSATVQVAPGAALHLLAGKPEGADWLLVCLDRDPARPGPCGTHIGPAS
jgi:hypothetical protein